MKDKNHFSEIIQININNHGYHLTIVNSQQEPRYAYTIGLLDLLGYELIFAGGIYFLKDDLFLIIKEIVNNLKANNDLINQSIQVGNLGTFSFLKTHASWNKIMALGVFNHFNIDSADVMQVIPDTDHYTQDIPNMTQEFNQSTEPIWQWLTRDWIYNVPVNSTVVTNIDSLRGQAITEMMRWEGDEWEMFAGAGPDVQKKDMRVVSLGTIIGIDKSLLPALSLNIGKGLWRDSVDSDWNSWG